MGDEKITGKKSPIAALFLNLCLFACVGYFYIGQWQKGLVVLAASLLLSFVGVGLVVWVIAVIDVFMQAKIMEGGGAVGHWTFFSQSA